jgi:hypothetical protein
MIICCVKTANRIRMNFFIIEMVLRFQTKKKAKLSEKQGFGRKKYND